jgi:hypothetical protein
MKPQLFCNLWSDRERRHNREEPDIDLMAKIVLNSFPFVVIIYLTIFQINYLIIKTFKNKYSISG